MKRLFALGAVVAFSGLVGFGYSGCSTGGGANEPRPVVRSHAGSKGVSLVNPVVVKAAASPSAKSKAKVKIARKPGAKAVPYGSSTDFTVDVESWPAGVTSVTLTARAYQITNFWTGSNGFVVTTCTPALSVFNNGTTDSTTVQVTTTSGPQTVSVTPPASAAGWQVLLGFTGSTISGGTTYKFGSGEIFVVNP
jgi:hypothetical protein